MGEARIFLKRMNADEDKMAGACSGNGTRRVFPAMAMAFRAEGYFPAGLERRISSNSSKIGAVVKIIIL